MTRWFLSRTHHAAAVGQTFATAIDGPLTTVPVADGDVPSL